MENCTSSQLIWPDLAPPVEAVHLRQTYNALKALLLPSETAGCLESSQSGLFRPNDHNDGRQLVPLALTIPLPLRRASSPSPRSYKSKQCIFKSKTNRFFSKESSGRFLGGGILEATAGSSSPAVRSSPWASTCSRGTKHEALRVSEEDVGSGINRSSNEKEDATPSKCSHNTLFLQRRGRSRARSSDREGILSSELYAGQGWFSANEGFPPVEIKSLVTRLQHRTYREKPASLRWDRVRSRSVDFTAVVHSNNANEGAYSECDIGLVLPTDKEVAEALRVEALERVRQRAREERVKQRRHEQELLLARQQQKQRSLMLSQQLRQKTLERIQEKCMREAEQRKDELELQVQRVEQAEAQRKYCARHRKELQQRLLQEQREMKHKIRLVSPFPELDMCLSDYAIRCLFLPALHFRGISANFVHLL
ncbi:hypothetical protein Esti_002530 [Eimeria stiedai]